MLLSLLFACSNDNDKATDPADQATLDVKAYVSQQLGELADAAVDLQGAAPAPDADGWSADADPDAVDAMRAQWKNARYGYETVEGAIAVLFPDYDHSTDARYDDYISEVEDTYLFDGEGVTGIHGIERILWSDQIPDSVVAFESGFPGYVAAAFPANEAEASDFTDGLCQRLVDDTAAMEAEFEPLALDHAAAFRGVIGSMAEQYEKVVLAATGEDESRYAQYTLSDMRGNLEGGAAIYAAFVPWLESIEGGAAVHAEIEAGFSRIDAAYGKITGDALPAVPADWNPDAPSDADLATPYGQLWSLLATEADPTISGSLVERMTAAADLLGIPQLP